MTKREQIEALYRAVAGLEASHRALLRRLAALERAAVVQTGGNGYPRQPELVDESPLDRARRTFDAGGVAWGHEPADEALRWRLGVDRRTER